MKIVHISLCSYPYISSWGYQENGLIDAHHQKGHDVAEISSFYVPPIYKEHLIKDESFNRAISCDNKGTKIIRLRYKIKLPFFINRRLRLYKGLYKSLVAENPDVIFVHDLQFLSLFELKKYAKKHPECVVKADTHVSEINSAGTLASKIILHKIFYKWIICSNYKIFQTIYYISASGKEFMKKYYNLSDEKVDFQLLPLGGIIFTETEADRIRKRIRNRHKLKETDILIIHSGKMEQSKRTHEIIKAFSSIDRSNLRMILIGSIPASQKEILGKAIQEDNRIVFLGWKKADELREYLHAADIYIQLGSQSSTLQAAMCAGCPCILNFDENAPGGGYTQFFDKKIAYPATNVNELKEAIEMLSTNREMRDEMRKNTLKVAHDSFDYGIQVEKIVHDNRRSN